MSFHFDSVYGVDFSGAKLAGRNIWVARAEFRNAKRGPSLRLAELSCLESLAGTAERVPALRFLVDLIRRSERALWGMDFPFGLPVEVMDDGCTWAGQLGHVRRWTDEAYALGLWCLGRAKALGGPNHIRRTTDVDVKAPFDCYHYRIIYQTFHGMRDVLGPLARSPRTAVLPFQHRRLAGALRVVCESCPGSTLKRMRLPHQNYKQPAGGPLTARRRRTRHAILQGLSAHVEVGDRFRRTIMRNPGGDALDAVIAAVGVEHAWRTADHAAVRGHARYGREGYVYS